MEGHISWLVFEASTSAGSGLRFHNIKKITDVICNQTFQIQSCSEDQCPRTTETPRPLTNQGSIEARSRTMICDFKDLESGATGDIGELGIVIKNIVPTQSQKWEEFFTFLHPKMGKFLFCNFWVVTLRRPSAVWGPNLAQYGDSHVC